MAGPLTASLKSGGKDLVKELNRRLAPAVGKYSVGRRACVDRQNAVHAMQQNRELHPDFGDALRTSSLKKLREAMFGLQMARSTLTWPVVRSLFSHAILRWFYIYAGLLPDFPHIVQCRYWRGVHRSLSSQGCEGHSRPSTRVHHCSAEYLHILPCHGNSPVHCICCYKYVRVACILYAQGCHTKTETVHACKTMSDEGKYLQVGLLDRLARIVPKGLDTHIFANSGSEVVENAIKMARAHTKKTNIICFDVSPLLT